MTDQLIPKQPRVMHQPRKDVLREQLALAATEIERLRAENEKLRAPVLKRAWDAITRKAA